MIEAAEQSPILPALLTDEIRISAHQGPVNCVAAARLSTGRVVLATAGGDGTLRRFDAATGQLLGEALGSHNRRVLTVAAATLPDGRVVLAAGGDDGIVRRVDAATGRRIGSGITGHSGTVWSVAAARLPDGRAILATGGNDRTVRRFDAATGRPVGDPLIGHTDWVRCVAAGTLPNGRVILATGSDDGTVRRFDAETGEPIGEPLTGHNDWVRCVAIAPLSDGTVVLASGGGDGAVWRHDAATGRVIGAPLANNTRRVLSLTAIGLPEGPVVLLTGGGDGAVRCFDAATGEPLGAPMVRHEDAVLGVTATELDDGRVILASGGAEGALVLSPLAFSSPEQPEGHGGLTVTPRPRTSDEGLEGRPAPGVPVEAVERTGSLALIDSTTGPDDLGRDVLAAHLHGMLAQLAHTQDTGTAVIHIDGRSGTGKSTVVTLLRRRLQAPAGTGGAEGSAAALLRHPVVLDYDAWREQAAGPPALTLARALHRGVRRQRAGVTGVAMSWTGTARQAARSPLVLAPAAVLLVTLGLAVTARPGGLWSAEGSAGHAALGVLAVLAATSAVVLAAGLAMAWSAAGFGRLSRLAGGGSPGELAASIARLRRWTPRRTRSQRLADTAFGLSVVLAVSWCAALLTTSAAARTSATVGARWVAGRGLALLVAAVGAAVVAGLWDWSPDAVRRVTPRGRPDGAAPGRGPRVSLVALTAVALFMAFAIRTPAPVRHLVQWHPEIWTAVLLFGIGWTYAAWTARGAGLPRRPLLLVVEHLDRCQAEHVVAVLEAIHTLMRDPATPRLWRRWRAPAPMGVLVAADGRWLRAAVEERYAGFDGLSSAVRGLGADFVQAVFDHTVLIPQLSAEQVQAYTEGLLRADEGPSGGARTLPAAGRRDRPARPAAGAPAWRVRRAGRALPGERPAANATRPAGAGRTRAVGRLSLRIGSRIGGRLGSDLLPAVPVGRTGPRPELPDVPDPAVLDAAPEAMAARSHHLLERYSHLLPANPRLVKRVANTWGMLLALQAHLQHSEDPDTLARAAIMLVRFPALADVLLSATTAPQADPGGLTGHERSTSAWLRPDVQQVLRREDGSVVPVERIARCYGREFARTLVP